MIRTFGRTLLMSAVALMALHSCANAQEESPLGHILEFQKNLNKPIQYELAVDTTLDKALDELLKQNGIPYAVNDAAFGPDNKDVLKKTTIEKIDKQSGVTRATILKNLLDKIPNDSGKSTPAYILRPDHLEITTRGALMEEFYPGWGNSSSATSNPDIPALVYAVFKETPFRDALTGLGHAAGVNVVLDGRAAGDFKVTAELNAAPFDAALRVLANMHDLKVVRVANIYYVTSPKNACQLQKEEEGRILKATAAVAAGGM
jgi:hypothetical protein